MDQSSKYSINTLCVQGGYTPGNGEPRQIPIVQSICEGGDAGKPVALNPNTITGQAFQALAENVVAQIEYRNTHLAPTQRVEVTKK